MNSIYSRFSQEEMFDKDLRAVVEQSRREWEAHVEQKMEEYWHNISIDSNNDVMSSQYELDEGGDQ